MAKKKKKKTDAGTVIFRLIGIEILVLILVLVGIGAKYAPTVMTILKGKSGNGQQNQMGLPTAGDNGSNVSGSTSGNDSDSSQTGAFGDDGTNADEAGTANQNAADESGVNGTDGTQTGQENGQDAAQTEAQTEVSYDGEVEQGSVSLTAVGDNLMHRSNTLSGKHADGTYSYYDNFCNMRDIFLASDFSVLSQDTVMAGTEYGVTSGEVFTTGTEIGDSMADAGINVVLAANNHILDQGKDGLNNMILYWKQNHPDVALLGVNQSAEEKNTPVYAEKNGITLAMINYTCKSNNTAPLDAEPYLLNRYDKEWLTQMITDAKQNADFVIVFPHWGTTDETDPTQDQMDQAQFLADLGADLIIGAYPHVVEPVKWVTASDGHKTLVYYSLGNFQSIQDKTENMLGGLASVTITKTDKRTYISDYDLDFTVTHYAQESTNEYFDIVTTFPYSQYTEDLAAKHGILLWDPGFSCDRLKELRDAVLAKSELN